MAKAPSFLLSERLTRPGAAPYDAQAAAQLALSRGDRQPTSRRLLVYTRDPSSPRMDAAVAEATVPFEPLNAGPIGAVIAVHDFNETTKETYRAVDLDGAESRFQVGLPPSTIDPRFAQQMCYALTMATYEQFRIALGRDPDFSFAALSGENEVKLHIYPHARKEDNAYYDPDEGALFFGYTFANKLTTGANQEGGIVFTSLAHDVVIHEMTHALLDGMRSHLMLPTNGDVDGFHEGFADLVALFQKFRYRPLVRRAIEMMGGRLTSHLLIDIARQWGETTSEEDDADAQTKRQRPLRIAFEHEGGPDDVVPKEDRYRPNLEAHDMGAVLLRAVFDAFRWVYERKTARLRALAPAGARMPAELIDLLTIEAEKLAGQFLNILIRAVDYCPPVDLRLGEYLRAIVTADYDLVPDDPLAYREAFVRAFRRYGIVIESVSDLSDDALLWCPPLRPLPRIEDDRLTGRRLDSDDPESVQDRATVLGHYIMNSEDSERPTYFGLLSPSKKNGIDLPVIESIRTLRRVSPNGSVNFDFVAEVVQRRKSPKGRWLYGGATIILDNMGNIRYLIVKNVGSKNREKRFDDFLRQNPGSASFFEEGRAPSAKRFRALHARRRQRPN